MDKNIDFLIQPFQFFTLYSERIHWLYLLTAFTIAFIVAVISKPTDSHENFIDFSVLKKILFHRSACNDYIFFYTNVLLQKTVLLSWFASVSLVISIKTQTWLLTAIPGWHGILTEKNIFLAIIFTLCLALIADFGIFLAHYLQHKLPLLWEFHKVHHSAEVLTPITVYRMHPVDDILNFSLGGILSGIALSLTLFLTTGHINIYNLAGSNLLFALFYFLGYNLRHSHLWLSYGRFWSKIFISPAQHQIHHSANPIHFDKNIGFIFAFWDAWLGTLYVPQTKEKLTFGLGNTQENQKFSMFWSLYLMPFINVAKNFKFAMLFQPKRYLSLLVFIGIVAPAVYLNNSKSAVVSTPPQQIYLEEMTWQETQQALNSGFKTVIIPTGGTEQNGLHLVLGKHNFIVKYTAGKIAEKLGKTLVAPVVAYVPEGDISPPNGHMRFAGTLSVSDNTFAQVLEQTAASLKQHGFKVIALIGDSGWNQAAQQQVAEKLNRLWQNQGVQVVQVNRYYDLAQQLTFLNNLGFSAAEIGQHAGIRDTSELMAVYPQGVRTAWLENHTTKNDVLTSGSDGDTTKAAAILGQSLLNLKVSAATEQIKPFLAER